MKRFIFLTFTFLLFTFNLYNCEKKFEWTNPLDSDSNVLPESWAPKNLQTVALNDAEIKLTWEQEEQRIEGFTIERISGDENFTPLAQIPKSQTTYTDTALHFGTEYTYRVNAYASEKKSNHLTSNKLTTIFPAPTELTATPINDQVIQLTWKDNCSFEKGYVIERKIGLEDFYEIKRVIENITSYSDSGLFYGQDYQYRIKGYTKYNETGYIVSDASNTNFPPPTDLKAFALNDSEIKLKWTDNCTFETGYKIERSDNSITFSVIGQVDSDITEFTDIGLLYDQKYFYRIFAYTNQNFSTFSNAIECETFFPAPTNLFASPISDSEIELTWQDNCSFEAGFQIEKDIGDGFFIIGKVDASIVTFIDFESSWDIEQKYRISAFTSINNSTYSDEKALIPAIILAPTNLQLKELDDAVTLSWVDNCNIEDGFYLERSDNSGPWQKIADITANLTQYIDPIYDFYIIYTYRVNAYVEVKQTAYTNQIKVEKKLATIRDNDGNLYKTIKIGTQWWMAENLRVIHYQDGSQIHNVTDNIEWSDLTTGASCIYDNNTDYLYTYGRLYNWFAIADSRNIAPSGWHIPSDEDWKQLEMYLGMSQTEADAQGYRGSDEGSKIKNTSGWINNGNGSNISGFSAMPGGIRNDNGGFNDMGYFAFFWSSTEYNSYNAWNRLLTGSSKISRDDTNKQYGYSVRCVKD